MKSKFLSMLLLLLSSVWTNSYGQVIGLLGGCDHQPGIVKPAISTNMADSITMTSARLLGYVNPKGQTLTVRFLHGSSAGVYSDSADADQSPLSGSSSQFASLSISGLTEETAVFYKIVAFDGTVRVEGSEFSFTTKSSKTAPLVTTSSSDNITTASADVHGLVHPNNLSTVVYAHWGISGIGFSDSVLVDESPISGASQLPVNKTLSNLIPATEYIYKFTAANDSGWAEGGTLTFMTTFDGSAPYVSSDSTSNITTTSAYAHGTINPLGLSTTGRLVYGSSSGVYPDTLLVPQNPLTGAENFSLSLQINNLSPSQIYYYRWEAFNDSGLTTGSQLSFTTNSVGGGGSAPIATTDYAVNDSVSAVLYGSVNPNGQSTIAKFRWGLEPGVWLDSALANESPIVPLPPDTIPDQFTFTDITDADLSTQYTSNTITLAGLDSADAVFSGDGAYNINGGSYGTATQKVYNGDDITIRVTSSAAVSTAVAGTLSIGGISDTYTVTTNAGVTYLHQSDFSADSDGWGFYSDCQAVGNTDGINGEDDCLTLDPASNSGYHRVRYDYDVGWIGKTVTIQFDYYIPSGNDNCDGIEMSQYIGTIGGVQNTTGSWTSVEVTGVTLTDQALDLIQIFLLSGGSKTATMSGNDFAYIKNFNVIEE